MERKIQWKYVLFGLAGAVAVLLLVWFMFFRGQPAPTVSNQTPNSLFGNSQNTPVPTINNNTPSETSPGFSYSPTDQKKIFEISEGPIASAVYVQMRNPTTTIARYIRQDSGHVFEQPLDAPGSAARIISNVTIPGIQNAVWTRMGDSVIIQYLEGDTIKTASLSFQSGGTATSSANSTRFLPDNIASIAASPDGAHIVYLVTTTLGSNGYIANYDGTGARQLFSIDLTQLRVSWPSLSQIMLQTKTAANTPGMAFVVSAKTGNYSPLLYATGLSLTASGDFSSIVYQTDNTGTRASYYHNVATGQDTKLSFQPIPEKCGWSYAARAVIVCATPNSFVPNNYLDLWHQGVSSVADMVVGYNLDTSADVLVATPGSKDGGKQADIAQLSVSPDGLYVLYIAKGERSLWGIRLNQ